MHKNIYIICEILLIRLCKQTETIYSYVDRNWLVSFNVPDSDTN